MEATMQQEDWKLKFEQLKRYHNSVARQWMRTQDLEREEQNNVVQKYEKKIADLPAKPAKCLARCLPSQSQARAGRGWPAGLGHC